MINQPALQTSSGAIWVIMGGLFTAASLIPLVMFIVTGSSALPIALVTAIIVVALYVLLVVLRFAIPRGPRRLWWLAACMLTAAVVALVGVWASALAQTA